MTRSTKEITVTTLEKAARSLLGEVVDSISAAHPHQDGLVFTKIREAELMLRASFEIKKEDAMREAPLRPGTYAGNAGRVKTIKELISCGRSPNNFVETVPVINKLINDIQAHLSSLEPTDQLAEALRIIDGFKD